MTDLLLDLAAVADELCNPIRTVERIVERDDSKHIRGRRGRAPRRVWVAQFPSLLDQLAQAVIPGETFAEPETIVGAHQPPGPRYPARLEAIDRLLAIQVGAAMWCARVERTLRDSAAANIRALVGVAPTLPSGDQDGLLSAMRGWHTWAAVASCWQRPDDAPRGTCPACDGRNTIRVRLATRKAFCVACGAWWDDSTMGVLAEHMAPQSVDTSALRTAAVLQRRAVEERYRGHEPRPNLPYVEGASAS